MIKKFSIIIFLSFFFETSLLAKFDLINSLKKEEKIIFIRHALAPGSGDPAGFSLDKCITQRNLNTEGIKQSKQIGLFFKKNQIPLGEILTSEWCRCKDTARYAFKNYKTFSPLNSFFDERFEKNKDKQIRELKKFIKNRNNKKNLVLITHYVVILELLDQTTSSGEAIVTDVNLNIIGKIKDFK